MFASDAMSSSRTRPRRSSLTLSVAGASAYALVAVDRLAVVVVLLTVVASYRQNVHAYPSGGGDYEVATTNLGPPGGLTVASALLVDYVADGRGVDLRRRWPTSARWCRSSADHKVAFAVGAIVLLTAVNLRGIRESGTAFAIPVVRVHDRRSSAMIVIGARPDPAARRSRCWRRAPSLTLLAEGDAFTGFALVLADPALVLLRAAAALTGVEAISNGVPAFRKPKSRNAATTLLLLGVLSVTMFMGLIALARLDRRADRRGPGDPVRRRSGGLRPADDDRPARRRGVLGVPARLLLRRP